MRGTRSTERSPKWVFALGVSLAVSGAACVNTDAAVFVDPTLSGESAKVVGGVLGVELEGAFTLELHLSARADGPSKVSLGDFDIVTAADKTAIGGPLPVTGDKTFPLTVEQDSTVTVHFTFDTGKDPLPASTKTALCASGGVAIKGTLTDSLAGSTTPVFSASFHPSGC